jgi:hypothetical protein
MKMEKLYNTLRELVANQYAITLTDKDRLNNPTVIISPIRDSHPWTRFDGKTIEEALQRAIDKLQNPTKDYVSLDGQVWKANDFS